MENGRVYETSGGDTTFSTFPCIPGPSVGNKQTSITLLTQPELVKTPFLSQLTDVINRAFKKIQVETGMLPESWDRLKNNQQTLDEIGAEGSAYILSTGPLPSDPDFPKDQLPRILSTASFKLLKSESIPGLEDIIKKFKRDPMVFPASSSVWELVLMAVDPQCMKGGLAKTLMDLVEAEILRRARQIEGVKEVTLTLTTAKEINYGYYTKNGYELTDTVLMEKGMYGNTLDISVALMEKTIWRSENTSEAA